MPEPFPWGRLQRLNGEQVPFLRALGHVRARAAMRSAASGPAGESENLRRIAIALGLPRVCQPAVLMPHIGVWGTSILVIARGHELRCQLALPSGLLRALGCLVFSDRPDEWPGPRPATRAELGIAALCTAALLRTRYGLTDVTVEPSPLSGPEWMRDLAAHARALLVPMDVVIDGETHIAHLIVDQSLAQAAPYQALTGRELLDRRGAWLASTRVQPAVMICCARMSVGQVRALAPRDVVLLERAPDAGQLRVGRGTIPVSVDLHAARIAMNGPYQRGNDMNELLFDDAMVDVTCRVGRVSLSVREVLQLEPGHVLALDTPSSGPLDLMCGETVIARAELVHVDDRVGVRILALVDDISRDDK